MPRCVIALARDARFDAGLRLPGTWDGFEVAVRVLGEPDANPFGAASALTPAIPLWLHATAQEALRPWRSYAAVLLALP
jgi:hypothetical protein